MAAVVVLFAIFGGFGARFGRYVYDLGTFLAPEAIITYAGIDIRTNLKYAKVMQCTYLSAFIEPRLVDRRNFFNTPLGF